VTMDAPVGGGRARKDALAASDVVGSTESAWLAAERAAGRARVGAA
jgi:hypothetical protein